MAFLVQRWAQRIFIVTLRRWYNQKIWYFLSGASTDSPPENKTLKNLLKVRKQKQKTMLIFVVKMKNASY